MSNDKLAAAVLADNFNDECGDPNADAVKAAKNAIKALKGEGLIISKDPEA